MRFENNCLGFFRSAARPSDPMTLKLPEVRVPVEKPKLAKSGGSDFNVLAPAGAFVAPAGAGILAL